MRKTILPVSGAAFMLFVFLFGNFGSFLVYDVSQTQNRKHINCLLHKSKTDLIALYISLKDLNDKISFEQNGSNEIVYKGHLYDVVRKEAKTDAVVFYCINDTKEEALNVQLNEQVKTIFDQTTGRTSGKSITKKITLNDYAPSSLLLAYRGNISCPVYFSSETEYISFYNEVLNPPPSFC